MAEINGMLPEDVIEPVTTECAAANVFALKKDVLLRFYVHFQDHNTVTIRNSYYFPRMDECIDILLDATVFPTLHASSE